jgi:polyferredoxin
MLKLNKKSLSVFLIIFLLLMTVTVLAEFGEEGGFGEQSQSFDNIKEAQNQQPYFIHDILKKLLFLILFVILSLYVVFKKRQLRKYVLIASVILLGFYLQGFLCPISAVQNIFIKYNNAYLLLFLIPVVLALFWGRVFCGSICPFGAIQELLYIARIKLKIPDQISKILLKLKYIILIYIVARILITNEVILSGYTPFKSLFIMGGNTGTIVLTVITALLSLIIFRPFCRFFCPLGALLGLISSLSQKQLLKLENCVECNKCKNECEVDAIDNGKINKKECICCGKCIDSCPCIKP